MYSEHLLAKLQLSRHAGHSDAGTCFNPRPPRGGRRDARVNRLGLERFQSTPPARGATRCSGRYPAIQNVSIHAPRAGGDAGIAALSSSIT